MINITTYIVIMHVNDQLFTPNFDELVIGSLGVFQEFVSQIGGLWILKF